MDKKPKTDSQSTDNICSAHMIPDPTCRACNTRIVIETKCRSEAEAHGNGQGLSAAAPNIIKKALDKKHGG